MKAKKLPMNSGKALLALAISASLGLTACGSNDHHKDIVKLRVLETTDLHTNIMDYNYYRDDGKSSHSGDDPTIGFARVSNLVLAARKEVKNSVLVDNGDLLQGSPMGDYMADEFKKNGNTLPDTHPAYKAMNLLDYDVGNIGNHEFNFGLAFLDASLKGADFPYINSNVVCDAECEKEGAKKGENRFTPYIIKEKQVMDTDGDIHTIKVGYIGFVPPQIMLWDAKNLTGKVTANDILESAKKYVPEMKAKGADVIVAIPHSGIGEEDTTSKDAENAVWALSTVEGIDAIMFGHSHAVFPSTKFEKVKNADIEKGQINGTAAVMPGRWGNNLGIVDLTLEKDGDNWKVVDSQSTTRPIFDGSKKESLVETNYEVRDTISSEHEGTRQYVNAPIGKASADMYSFLSMAQDDPSVQIVADAQMWYAKKNLDVLKEHKDLPILSAAAPFKAGGRYSSADDSYSYVQVPAGKLAFKNAADLYLYPNTMVAVKVTGAELKEWLECSANQFKQIDPNSTEPQSLVEREKHRTYNFDSIEGVTYQIDVTQPSNYDNDCKKLNVEGGSQRIVNLTYTKGDTKLQGEKLAAQDFIVVTNNYRAYGAKFAGTGKDHIVADYAIENRQVLIDYIKDTSGYNPDTGESSGEVVTSADNNWDFKNIDTNVALDVRFETQDSKKAADFVEQNKRRAMKKLDAKAKFPGFAVYSIDMKKIIEK
ncbi:bifunctional 2',3'-cyclic-nucleotide 2'-phosphodiesterase/3'-nucleotidase [Parashewanella tropica]|uniref:bifunctional 2',3'-cyclic-nucleotide 2'-phosphodiesterase/3'-nucleotidase n=1 Tax=Parashewanella tropica TaxID=2547970 RepID=UPI001FE4EDB8|nr:bifunctional 2',3'-cyclic-nucleotide 2'-phosphodiesterase/3'-nucleotidase [Parashewanella tropica]